MKCENVMLRVADDLISAADARQSPIASDRCPDAPSRIFDFLTFAFLATVILVACFTVKDYAISNDEGVQHHYGELIIAYYQSGFRLRDVFTFENLYLYGGLFDVIAIWLG